MLFCFGAVTTCSCVAVCVFAGRSVTCCAALLTSRHVSADLAAVAVDEVMVELLVANDKEVVFTACGVLINLMSDEERRGVFRKHGGVSK